MSKLFSAFLLAAIAFATIWAVRPEWLPWESIETETTALAAAQEIRTAMDTAPEEAPEFRYRDADLDKGELFRTLESIWSYAFTLSTTTHRNGMLTVSVELENAAAQRQAAVFAQGIAQQQVRADAPLRERLRTLHDQLVRTCVYDTATAESESLLAGSGADAPFTAAGAIVNGRAVCAGYSRAFMQLCDAVGIDALYISDAGMNHGWNAVRVYDEILYIDATFDDPVPDQGDRVLTKYFLKTGDELAQTHQWDRAFYDALLEQALPESLGAAQRIYDLGLLPEAPRAQAIAEPLSAAARTMLEQYGMTFHESETLGGAAKKTWDALTTAGLTGTLLEAGVFDEVRARQVGIPEDAVKK